MGLVEICHFPAKGGTVRKILEEGLKSREQLIKEGKLEHPGDKGYFPDHLSNIYFYWEDKSYPKAGINDPSREWISIEVDPSSTYVNNLAFRERMRRQDYLKSSMSLEEFIQRWREMIELSRGLEENQSIIMDPYSAKASAKANALPDRPFGRIERREQSQPDFYSNEILIPRAIIPPSEFKRYHIPSTI